MKVLQSKKCGSSSEVIFPTNRGKPTPNLAKYQEKSDLSTFLFLLRKLLFLSLINDNGARRVLPKRSSLDKQPQSPQLEQCSNLLPLVPA